MSALWASADETSGYWRRRPPFSASGPRQRPPEAVVKPLGTSGEQAPGKIVNVELLGHKGKVQWKQEADRLKVQLPAEKPSEHAVTLKVVLA